MQHVERVHRALLRQSVDQYPVFMSATPQFLKRATSATVKGATPVQAWKYCTKLNLDVVQVAHPSFHPNRVLDLREGRIYVDDWGRHHIISKYYDEFIPPFPLQATRHVSLGELRENWAAYYFTNAADPTYFTSITAIVRENQQLPDPLSVWGVINGPLEPAWSLISDGWPEFFILARLDWDLANAILEKVTNCCIIAGQAMIDHGADVIRIGDDYALNDRLMCAPEIWRKLIYPHHCRLVRALKQHGGSNFPVILHSDGNITAILEDLACGGIDALNPIQPGALDFETVARQVGERLALTGAFDLRLFLQPLTPAAKQALNKEIDRLFHVIDEINAHETRTGFCIGPSHQVQPASDVATFETWVSLVHQTNKRRNSKQEQS